MNNWKCELIHKPSEKEINEIRGGLIEFNRKHIDLNSKTTRVLRLLHKGEFAGGLITVHAGDWLEIPFFWIKEEFRGMGKGTELLLKAEEHARELNCSSLFLNTLDFQARPFYEKKGFSVVYTQKNYLDSCTRYFMEKHL